MLICRQLGLITRHSWRHRNNFLYRNLRIFMKFSMQKNGKRCLLTGTYLSVDYNTHKLNEMQYKEQMLKTHFEKHSGKNHLTDMEWTDFREDVMSSIAVNDTAFDAFVMSYFKRESCYLLGRSFINYIRSKNTPNLLTLALYISLCGKCRSESNESEILLAFSEIHPDAMMNIKVAEPVVSGLACTSKWRTCIDIIHNSKDPTSALFSHVISAAFRNGEYDIAWDLLKEMTEHDLEPLDSVFEDCVEGAAILPNVKATIEQMFTFCRTNHIFLSKRCVGKLKQLMEDIFHFKVNFVNMQRDICSQCKTRLERIVVNSADLKILQDRIVSQVMIGSDIFQHSTPTEVANFLQFVKNVQPYDIVIDGLNVALYNAHKYSKSKSVLQLLSVIRSFKGKRVLVIGNKYMLHWSKAMAAVRKEAVCYFADELTKDDPFFMYAALVGGPNTCFISGDILRDHKFKLEKTELTELFDRWRSSHQIRFIGCDRAGKPKFVYPLKQDIRVQGDWKRGWHVPYKDDNVVLGPYDYCTTWICIYH